jgi:hypothetical protein
MSSARLSDDMGIGVKGEHSMPGFHRMLWRAAGHIEQALQTQIEATKSWRVNWTLVAAIPKLAERFQLVKDRGWDKATGYIRLAMQSQLLHCKTQINDALHQLETRYVTQSSLSQSLIYAELLALSHEFEEVAIDLKRKTVVVVTESIVIYDVPLGRFQISLDWKKCAQLNAVVYSVTALEPNRPISNSRVTHPHVLNHMLCEGDASVPLKQALYSGRLSDFFQIIQCVLRTYNSDSPYVSLGEWKGVDCHACGAHVSKDASDCGHCAASVCKSCSSWCAQCQISRCDACTEACAQCGDRCCPECLRLCLECRVRVCPNCLTSNEYCENCDDATPSDEPQANTTATTCCAPAEPAI